MAWLRFEAVLAIVLVLLIPWTGLVTMMNANGMWDVSGWWVGGPWLVEVVCLFVLLYNSYSGE